MNKAINYKLKQVRHLVFTTLFLYSFVSALNAQSLNDEFKLKLRESLINPEKPASQQQQLSTFTIQDQMQKEEVLKVSPYTKLPTKADGFNTQPMPEMKIHLYLQGTNSIPFNVRPTGSMRYVQNGKGLTLESDAGKAINPSGRSFFPPRTRSPERTRKVKQIIENW